MKITDIQVDCFGHWKELELPDLSSGITVIHGPNEAGKSTLLDLIRAILCGFNVRQHARFVPPRYPGSIGGQLQVRGTTGHYRIQRRLSESKPFRVDDPGDLSVQAIDGSLQGKHILATLLGGVDDAIFRNVFAVGLSEMQQLATLSDTEAARQLYGLAVGTDRVSVAEVSRQLDESRDLLINGDHDVSIGGLLQRRQELLHELEHPRSPLHHWLELFEQGKHVDDEIAKLERRRKRLGHELESAEARTILRSDWKKCRSLHRKIQSLGPVTEIPVEVVRRLDELSRQLKTLRKQWENFRIQRRRLREQSRSLAGHPALMHHAELIQSLKHRSGWIMDLTSQMEKSKAEIEELEFELQGELERLGVKSKWRLETVPLITDEMIADLKEPANEARKAKQRGEAAEGAEHEGRQQAETLQRQLRSKLPALGSSDLSQLIKDEEKKIGWLQKRIQLQGQLDVAQRKLTDSREEHHRWAQRQLLPWRGLMALGTLFSIGIILLLMTVFAEFFRIERDQRWTFGFIGAAGCGFALLIKALLEMAASRSTAHWRHEVNTLRKHIDRLREDVHRTDAQLPTSHEPLAVQLHEAEDSWHELSELQPVERERQEALERIDVARAEKEQADAQYREARRRWRDRLRHHDLPESMSPSQFRKLSSDDSKIGQQRQKLIEAQRLHSGYHDDQKEIRDRLQMLFERIGEAPESDRLDEQIEQVFRLLSGARESHQQRDTLHRKWRELSRQQEEVARAAQRLIKRRRQLIAKYGVVDSHELKATVKRRHQIIKLSRERDRLLRTVAKPLRSVRSVAQLKRDLEKGDLEVRLRKWERNHDGVVTRMDTLLEKRGQLRQQIRDLTSQRSVSKQRLQLSELQTRLSNRIQQWATVAGVSSVLADVRQSYESDRQPETLADASNYLKQMTAGRYPRVWTPFGESSLSVDHSDGKSIRVEDLSRGTREQVFLSLRLALAAAYGRRGVSLPLILDDVFVNFDAQRARGAAETIRQFAAAGHQVLVFTCHDHIRDVFWKMGVDLRILPDAEQNAQSPTPVLKIQQLPDAAEPTLATETVASGKDRLPADGDPELDHELSYGAPEYDPGYQSPAVTASEDEARIRRHDARDGSSDGPAYKLSSLAASPALASTMTQPHGTVGSFRGEAAEPIIWRPGPRHQSPRNGSR